jgi:hypothetical protein
MAKFKDYDVIIVENALETMYNPISFVKNVHERISQNGYLVLASSADWNESVTEKQNWLGGYRKDGEPVFYLENIKEILSDKFTLIGDPVNIPFAVRLSARKFDYRISNVTVWQKK